MTSPNTVIFVRLCRRTRTRVRAGVIAGNLQSGADGVADHRSAHPLELTNQASSGGSGFEFHGVQISRIPLPTRPRVFGSAEIQKPRLLA